VFSLQDLVGNRSISDDGADLLRAVGAAGRSFLVYALPRNAGKSTVAQAIVAEAPSDLPRQEFYGSEGELASLSAEPGRGYLLVGEIGHRGRPGYLAGEEVVRLFRLLADGYSVASSLHADSVDEVFDVLRANGVPPETAAAAVQYVVKVRALGDPDDPSTRRVVEQIHEITTVDEGVPAHVLLYQRDGQPVS
jgi:hypothetical protein